MSCLSKDKRVWISRDNSERFVGSSRTTHNAKRKLQTIDSKIQDLLSRSHDSSSSSDKDTPPRDSGIESSSSMDTGPPNNFLKLRLEKADCLCQLGRLKEAISLYTHCSNSNGDFTPERLKHFIEALSRSATLRENGSVSWASKCFMADPWSCSTCFGVLSDPISLPCGHCYCRKCLERDLGESLRCRKCGQNANHKHLSSLRINVLVNRLVQKYWDKDLKALALRNQGNQLFQESRHEEALKIYTEALDLGTNDHILYGNRSHLYFKSGEYLKALEDADAAIKLKPEWAKGHYRRAVALQKLNRQEQAFEAFYKCLILEEGKSKPVRNELTKVLFELMSRYRDQEEQAFQDQEDSGTDQASHGKRQRYLRRVSTSEPSHLHNLGAKSDLDLGVPTDEPRPLTFQSSTNASNTSLAHDHPLYRLLDDTIGSATPLRALTCKKRQDDRPIDPEAVDVNDYECSLCFRLLYEPVTTPCGHTFCRMCLDRSLDHNSCCPMCKGNLDQYLAERRESLDEFVDESIRRLLPEEHKEREKMHDKEMEELAGAGNGTQQEVPVFVCTMTFPSIPCPLHVFEPRYRLMIRRCMETGTREFGMCCRIDDTEPFAQYGTLLEIRDIQYFPDGRAVVDTVGGRRFKVISRDVRDGYHTAKVEFIKDDKVLPEYVPELKSLHQDVLTQALSWFNNMPQEIRDGIVSHYGQIPDPEVEYWNLPNGPSWLWWILVTLPVPAQMQLQILSMTTLGKRLEAVQKIVRFLTRSR